MSKMGQYIQWCMDAGYVNRQGEVYSMDHVEEYMKTQELFMAQAPSWNFELDEEQLLNRALELEFVTKIGDDKYLMNNDYIPLRDREEDNNE